MVVMLVLWLMRRMAGVVASWPPVRPGEVYACEPLTPCRLPEILLVMIRVMKMLAWQQFVLSCHVVCLLVLLSVLRLCVLRQALPLFLHVLLLFLLRTVRSVFFLFR